MQHSKVNAWSGRVAERLGEASIFHAGGEVSARYPRGGGLQQHIANRQPIANFQVAAHSRHGEILPERAWVQVPSEGLLPRRVVYAAIGVDSLIASAVILGVTDGVPDQPGLGDPDGTRLWPLEYARRPSGLGSGNELGLGDVDADDAHAAGDAR